VPKREPERMSHRELIEEIRRLRHLLSRHLSQDDTFWMESGISSETGEPFVHLHWGDMAGQLTPAQIHEHARGLIETAAAAEFDAAFVKVMTDPDKAGLSFEQAMIMLGQVRVARGSSETASAEKGRT
jgi:hypothetical protein